MSARLEPDLACLPANADEARLARIIFNFIGCVRSGAAMDEVMRAIDARWLAHTPMRTYLLTPRPSMPPRDVVLAGEKPGRGSQDFCRLVFNKVGTRGSPKLHWLTREGDVFHGQMVGASI